MGSIAGPTLIHRWLMGATALGAVALTLATIGVPPFFFVAGAWGFAAALNEGVPALSGPTSWLAGAVVEATFLIAESGALAILVPHPHAQWVYVVTLLVPFAVASAAYWWWVWRGRGDRASSPSARSAEPWLALMCLVLIEAMFEAIKLHGHDFGLTWFMTGDARNQVVGTRQILGAGGLTLHEMTSYPAVTNAVTAIFDGAAGRDHLSTGAMMVRDVQAMVATVVVTCVGVALALVAAVSETVVRPAHDERRLPRYLVVALGACGSIAIGALFLGLGSSGGFLSAMGGFFFALAGLVLAMRIASEYDDVAMWVLVAALVLAVGSWTFLGVIPGLGLAVGIGRGARRWRAAPRATGVGSRAVLAVAALTLGAIVIALLVKGATLIAQLKSAGGIVQGNPGLFYWCGAATVVAVLIAPTPRQRRVRSLVLGEYLVLAILVAWMHSFHPGGVSWSYYATKTLWLATCAVAWVPFVVLADALAWVARGVAQARVLVASRVALALVGSSGILWGISHETPYPFPWHWAFIGSTFPSPMMVETVLRESATGEPFVFWQYSSPADDKLGDFWSALTWDYTANGALRPPKSGVSFPVWASGEQGSLRELCFITSHYRLRVVTKNPVLVPTLVQSCPSYLRAAHPVVSRGTRQTN